MILRVASRPFIPGMCTFIVITSGLRSLAAAMTSSPVARMRDDELIAQRYYRLTQRKSLAQIDDRNDAAMHVHYAGHDLGSARQRRHLDDANDPFYRG